MQNKELIITVFGQPLSKEVIETATRRMKQGNFKVVDVSMAIYRAMLNKDHKKSYRIAVAIVRRFITLGKVKRIGMTKFWKLK